VLEDDSFVSDRFVDVLSVAAEDLRENPSWLYMKLFRTSAFDGFSFTFRHIFELVVYGFVISLSACWLFSTKVRVYVTLVRVIVIWVLASSSLYILGRQNTILALTRRAGIHEISGDPSIVGVLYPVSIIPKYIEYMKGPLSRFETDLVLTDFQEKYDLKGYVLRPNLVEHVGAKTSLAAKAKLRSTISLSNLYKRCLVSEWFYEFPQNHWPKFEDPLFILFIACSMYLISALSFRDFSSTVGFRAKYQSVNNLRKGPHSSNSFV